MKIGTFAKKYDTSISTVRHYMELGLLLPAKKGGQYSFTDADCMEMECILELKASGFQLREMQKYISLLRLYDSRDAVLYEKIQDILVNKYDSMRLEKQQLEQHMLLVEEKIRRIKSNGNQQQAPHSVQNKNSVSSTLGVPLEFISAIRCPFCQGHISLENVIIQENTISEGVLHCKCGYQALIKDGIIFSGDTIYADEEPEFSASYYGGDPFVQSFDSMLFECIDKSSIQFLTAMHKSGVWLDEILNRQECSYPCILFPDIATHFLYGYYDKSYLKGSLLLVTALTERALIPMKRHLSSLNSELKIVYLVNQDGNLPLKNGFIDLVVDFFGTADLSFFSKTPYLQSINRCLGANAAIAGTIDYYASGAKSLKNIQRLYKNALQDNLKLATLKKTLSDYNFEIVLSENTCSNFDPGEYFEYHEPGETRSNFAFFAKRCLG